jgi:uncharacterized RDD family membrane protein YckC
MALSQDPIDPNASPITTTTTTMTTTTSDQGLPPDSITSSTDTPAGNPEGAAPVAAGLGRRVGALVYDGILVLAVLFFATALVIIPYDLGTGHPYPRHLWSYWLLLRLYQLAVVVAFFVYFWTRGGQTLGLRAWRLRVTRTDRGPLSVRDALRRLGWAALGLAPAGLGLWWCLFDREHLAWYDRRSGTRVVRVPRT